MAAGFLKIGEERLKESSISRYKYNGQSTVNKKWYITIWFSKREQKFSFETEKEALDIVSYLDIVLNVKVI